jgi:uncharacterized protein YkwD
MARARLRLLVIAGLSALAACSGPSMPDDASAPPGSGGTPSATASALVDLTNAERARAGLVQVRAETRLMRAAQMQAEQVAAAGRLDHTLPDARYARLEDRLDAAGYRWQLAGENLAFGQRNAASAIETWMQSAPHRANILQASFTEIGTGFVADPNGRPYYVQVFARPAGQ